MQNFSWQDLLTIAGFMLGVVSLIAYIEQRKSANSQKALLVLAERQVDREVTQQTVDALHEQRLKIEHDISVRIPALARAAVLREQAEMHARMTSEHFVAWRRLTSQIGEQVANIDSSIKAVVLDRLLPEYDRREKQERQRVRLTILSVALAIVTSLPQELRMILQLVISIPFAAVILQMTIAHLGRRRSRRVALMLLSITYVAAMLAATGFFTLVLIFDHGATADRIGAIALGALVLGSSVPYYRWASAQYRAA